MGAQCQLDIGKADGFVSVPEIIGEHQLVLIDIHCIHENIDDALSVSHVLHIAIFELIDPADNHFSGIDRAAELCLQDGKLKLFPLGFQLLQHGFRGTGVNACKNSIHQILEFFLAIL